MSFVLDSSVALTWAFRDENTPATRTLLAQAAEVSVFVPCIWPYEVSHNLQRAFRQGRLVEVEVRAATDTFAMLDLRVTPPVNRSTLRSLIDGMREHGLSAYDLSFLLLAQQLRLPLATLDGQLARAAAQSGVELML